MEIERTEGLVLQMVPFRNYDQILTVFTESEGISKFLYKGAFSSKQGKGSATSTLVRAEFFFTRGKGELFLCREAGLIDSNLHLRRDFPVLEAACDLAQALLASQIAAKPARELYALLLHYLAKLPQAKDPTAVSGSFRLKILRYEGLLNLAEECAKCQERGLAIAEGECYCKRHAPPYATALNAIEKDILMKLAFTRHFPELAVLSLPNGLYLKIKELFNASFKQ